MFEAWISIVDVGDSFPDKYKKDNEVRECHKAPVRYRCWNQALQVLDEEVLELDAITSFGPNKKEPRVKKDARGLTSCILVPVKDDPSKAWVQIRIAGGNSPVALAKFGL